ncbi:MAG: hypothetical protein AB1714_12670 [Acidobacteriota bacterium]
MGSRTVLPLVLVLVGATSALLPAIDVPSAAVAVQSPGGDWATGCTGMGGAGLYRYIECLMADYRQFGRVAPRVKQNEIDRQLNALQQLRRKLDELERTYGAAPASPSVSMRKTADLLMFLGYEPGRDEMLKPAGGLDESLRRTLLARAGVDLEDLTQRLANGQNVTLSLPYFQAAIPQEHLRWFREALGEPKLSSDELLIRFLNDLQADMLYIVLARTEPVTLEFLRQEVGLRALYESERLLWGLYNFGDSLQVDIGTGVAQLVLPGMLSPSERAQVKRDLASSSPSPWARDQVALDRLAMRIWSDLLGCSTQDSPRLTRSIFENGKSAYFVSVMAKQPRLKQQVLLGLRLPETQALDRARRLFRAARLPFADAYEQHRLSWRRLWDFQDLVMHAEIDERAGEIRMPASPLAWHIALSDGDPIEDQQDMERLLQKLGAAQGRSGREKASLDPLESFLEIAEHLEDARGDVLLAQQKSPAEKFAAIQAIFRDQPEAVGNLSLPALYRNYERHGAAYRLVEGIPLGGQEQRVLDYLFMLHRIDQIGNRELRNTTIKLFQSCMRILQITALNDALPASRVTELYDQFLAVRPDSKEGLGRGGLVWVQSLLGALGCAADGEAHSVLAATLAGAGQPIDVPLAEAGEGIRYRRYDAARLAARTAGSFLSQQSVNTLDVVLGVWLGVCSTLSACQNIGRAPGADVPQLLAELESAAQTTLDNATLVRLPESETLRRLLRENVFGWTDPTLKDLVQWRDAECNLLVREVIQERIGMLEALESLRKEVADARRRLDRAVAQQDRRALQEAQRRLAERVPEVLEPMTRSLNCFLANTLLGYLYAKDLDPRYPVRSGLVVNHTFERPDREEIVRDNPWEEGRLADLIWGSKCMQKGAIVGSVDFIPFATRGFRLGRMLDVNATASHSNLRLEAQFSAMSNLPAPGRINDAGMRFVAGCYDLGVSILMAHDRVTSSFVARTLPDILGRKRYAVLQGATTEPAPGEATLTPSELYFLGRRLLQDIENERLRVPEMEIDLARVEELMALWQDASTRASVRELVGLPLLRTHVSVGLDDRVLPPYDDFEVDPAGARVVERIHPRVMLCVVMNRLQLPARLIPAIQPALFDRVLEGAPQLHLNDWLSIEESARRVTTDATVQDLVLALARGSSPVLTAD